MIRAGKLVGSVAAATVGLGASIAAAQVHLTAETASPGGPPNLSMSHLAEVASAAGVASFQIQAGQTLTNTVLNVAEGKTDVGNAPLLLVFLLSKSLGPYATLKGKGAEIADNLRALYPYNLGSYTLFAFDSTGIADWGALKGRTVFNGPPRGAAVTGARQLVKLVTGLDDGKDYKGLQVNWGQADKTISDGSADAFLLPESHPSQRIVTAQAAGTVVVYSIPKAVADGEAFKRWATSPGNAPTTIDAARLGYRGVKLKSEDGVFRGVNITGADVVHKKMDVELARKITAAYIASMEKLKAKTPFAPNLGIGELDATLSGFCGPNPLKYHPGAIAAWEAAGYKVPDCARPKP
ncbi:MAG: TAXI family TRAP transporter solute-binding subunit [Lautropia sp.]